MPVETALVIDVRLEYGLPLLIAGGGPSPRSPDEVTADGAVVVGIGFTVAAGCSVREDVELPGYSAVAYVGNRVGAVIRVLAVSAHSVEPARRKDILGRIERVRLSPVDLERRIIGHAYAEAVGLHTVIALALSCRQIGLLDLRQQPAVRVTRFHRLSCHRCVGPAGG